MSRPVRTIRPFYEATERFLVSKDAAHGVVRRSVGAVSRHVGPIALAPIRGIVVPLGKRGISPVNVRLPEEYSGRHNMVVTARPIVGSTPDNRQVSSLIASTEVVNTANGPRRAVTGSTAIIRLGYDPRDPGGLGNIQAGIQVVAASFGLDECVSQDSGCVLDFRAGLRTPEVIKAAVVERDPFCGPCGDRLTGLAQVALQANN